MTEGCIHICVKDGKIQNVFCHLSELPRNGVVHLKPDKILTNEEFSSSHPKDKNELSVECEGRIFNLGSESI